MSVLQSSSNIKSRLTIFIFYKSRTVLYTNYSAIYICSLNEDIVLILLVNEIISKRKDIESKVDFLTYMCVGFGLQQELQALCFIVQTAVVQCSVSLQSLSI